ncbi:MAG: response regulator transcription factor [Solirubrobacterales bacterium]|nr:response regulator transcription factor [Solirubrobacterales bacterium]
MSVRIVLADDHVPTRAGIRAALEEHGFTVCAEVGSGPAAVEAAREHAPDICLLDIQMPGGGIAAAAEITAALSQTQVIMLTASERDEDLFAALQAGAAGYLTKHTDPARLPLAIQGVLDGEAAIPRHLVTRVLDEFRERPQRRRPRLLGGRAADLSEREWQVLELLREGLTTKAIAVRLGVSDVTVRRHISAAVGKLGVEDRGAAIALFGESDS